MASEDVDAFWSDMMDYLQQKHLPAYSLISQFGFPLSLRDGELVIGVMKENFQKMIENKTDNLKAAAKHICGKDLFIKVKVTGEERPKPVDRQPPLQASGHPKPPLSDTGAAAGANAASSSFVNPGPLQSLPPEFRASEPDSDDDFPVRPAPPPEPPRRPASTPDTMAAGTIPGHNPSADALMIKEAYKLFEGPGSRQIG
jgi:hypothetical protein